MRLTDIDLRLLRVFKAVAEAGGFVKAQAELGISQPAISSHIANLEQRLSVRLCNRGRQGFSLTSEGEQVLTETNLLLSHLDSYAARLNAIGQRTEALIRVGVVDCLVTDSNNPMSEIMRDAQVQFENVHVRIGVYDYLDCLNELRAGRIDFAFVGLSQGEQVPDDIEACHVYDEVSGLFCSRDHECAKANDPETLDALLKDSKISAHSFLLNPIDEDLDMRLLDAKSEQSQSNIETTTYLTLAGSHIGLIPVHFANFWTREERLVELAPERYRVISEIHVLRLRNQPEETAARWFWEKCKS